MAINSAAIYFKRTQKAIVCNDKDEFLSPQNVATSGTLSTLQSGIFICSHTFALYIKLLIILLCLKYSYFSLLIDNHTIYSLRSNINVADATRNQSIIDINISTKSNTQ